jgi:hypothetical protein
MSSTIYLDRVKKEQFNLAMHDLFRNNMVESLEDLKVFMQSHVYAVWDFMSMLKYLQNSIVPSSVPWTPTRLNRSSAARLINEIVVAEESDQTPWGGSLSHFDLYCQCMLEVGADTAPIEEFIAAVQTQGIDHALTLPSIPAESRKFLESTFGFINSGKPHCVASAFCFGRETLITEMFSNLLGQLKIPNNRAPRFYHYLDRHIEIDGDEHGPASLDLIESLCEKDPVRIVESELAAVVAIHARVGLWDGIAQRLETIKSKTQNLS